MPSRKRITPLRVKVEIDSTARDFVMARLLAARSSCQATIDAIDEATELFLDPDEDKSGKERGELVDAALESAGCTSRALESAEQALGSVDPTEIEPWEDDEEGEDDGD